MTVRIALYFFFLPKATEAWIGTILSTQVTGKESSMSESVRVVIIVLAIIVGALIGHLIARFLLRPRPHISGKLLIDTTGDKDRWTIFFDDDLGDIEKMDQITLRIEKVE